MELEKNYLQEKKIKIMIKIFSIKTKVNQSLPTTSVVNKSNLHKTITNLYNLYKIKSKLFKTINSLFKFVVKRRIL